MTQPIDNNPGGSPEFAPSAWARAPWREDAELIALERRLDELGAADAARAPAGLAGRIAAATTPMLAADSLRLTRDDGTTVVARPIAQESMTAEERGGRRQISGLPLRLAAAVGLAATLGAALLAVRSSGPVSQELAGGTVATAHPVDDWFTATELWADGSGEQLDTLSRRASTLGAEVDDLWSVGELFTEEGSL